MKASRSPGRWIIILLGAGLLLALAPATALAQTLYAQAVLYEFGEVINCHPGGSTNPLTDPLCAGVNTTNGFGTRISTATLAGGVPNPSPVIPGTFILGGFALGPPELTGGTATLDATAVVSRVDLTGPIFAKFTVTNALGGTVTGTLSGQLDLSLLAKTPPTPLAPVSGHWRATGGLKAGGTFAGLFLVPFACTTSPTTGACYAELDATGTPTGGTVPVALDELVVVPGVTFPVPLVKLLVTLFTN